MEVVGGGLISAKLSLLKSLEGPFDSRLRFGYEDTELACRLLHRDIKVLYNAKAKSFIIRPVDFESFCRRRYMQGRALYRAARMHPEIIIPRYNLQNAANLYHSRYEPFLDEWSSKVIKFEPLLNNQSHLQDPEYDRHLESLYTVYRRCFIGYWLKGYVEQMQAVQICCCFSAIVLLCCCSFSAMLLRCCCADAALFLLVCCQAAALFLS